MSDSNVVPSQRDPDDPTTATDASRPSAIERAAHVRARCLSPDRAEQLAQRFAHQVSGAEQLADTLSVLTDPARLRVFSALDDTEMLNCDDLALGLGSSPKLVWQHLEALLQAGLVESQSDGGFTHYRVAKQVAERVRAISGLT